MKKTITFCLVLFTFVCHAQSFEWFKTPADDFDGNASLIGYPNTIDPSGNICVAGFKDNRFLYGTVFGHVLLNKYSAAGNLLFSTTIEGHVQAYAIKSDAAGNILMLAGYVQHIKIGSWEITTVEQGIQPIMLKFDIEGNLLWNLPLNTIDPFIEHAEALTVDPVSNNYYVAFDNYDTGYIQKIAPDGTILSTITQEHTRVTSICLDTEQNIYAAGACASQNSTFAGVNAPTELFYNTYVVKYNAAGQYQWVRYIEDVTCPAPMVVARTPDEVYFCSYLFGAYAFGDFTTEGPDFGSFNDFFLTKLDANGAFQWVREVPAGDGFGEFNLGNRNFLAVDNIGKVYVAGSISRIINWGNEILTDIPGNSGDAAILRYNSDGTIEQVITGGGTWDDRVDGISIDSNGAVYASGMGYGATNFGPFTYNATAYFPYLTKINSTLKNNTNTKDESLLYPNPAKDVLYCHNMYGKATIYNMLGQVVMQFKATENTPISISSLPSGTYMVAFDGIKTHKLIKE